MKLKGEMEVETLSLSGVNNAKVRRAEDRMAAIMGTDREHEVSVFSPVSADAFVTHPANMCGEPESDD